MSSDDDLDYEPMQDMQDFAIQTGSINSATSLVEGTNGSTEMVTPAKSPSASTAATADTVLSRQRQPRTTSDDGENKEEERLGDNPDGLTASSLGRGVHPNPSDGASSLGRGYRYSPDGAHRTPAGASSGGRGQTPTHLLNARRCSKSYSLHGKKRLGRYVFLALLIRRRVHCPMMIRKRTSRWRRPPRLSNGHTKR